ncbi:MAG: hypothetical protein GXO82_06775 [Chlorobi bacterium]|nr:hypothetical protein [Chlorobiota bacterium]
MAKQQSFADKLKGKKKDTTVVVKCVFSELDEEKQTWKFRERLLHLKDVSELETVIKDKIAH